MKSSETLRITTPTDREVVTRVFDAPRERNRGRGAGAPTLPCDEATSTHPRHLVERLLGERAAETGLKGHDALRFGFHLFRVRFPEPTQLRFPDTHRGR